MKALAGKQASEGVASIPMEEPLDFADIYDAWFNKLLHWLRALGVAEADLEDVAQEVFLVVQRQLFKFDGRNLAGWLYRISARAASDYRRRSWFRNLFSRSTPLEEGTIELIDRGATPLELLERKQLQRVFHRLVAKMSRRRRTTFMLSEVEGYSSAEIAALEGIPVATVRTRLHHARKDFLALVEAFNDAEER